MSRLDNIEKGVIQILISYGIVEDSQLRSMVRAIESEMSKVNNNATKNRNLEDIFRRCNTSLRKLSMEIKSVVTKDEITNHWQYHHGLANVSEDQVATDFGSQFDSHDAKFFGDVINALVDKRCLSSNDIYNIAPSKWSERQTDTLLETFSIQKWIRRDSRGFWEIGLRTHLELKTFLETAIRNTEVADKTEEERKTIHQEMLSKLPQLIVY